MQQDTNKTNAQHLDALRKLRQQNSELEETKAFYETIMESILNGVWVSDKDDVIFYANKGMEIISGLPGTQITRGNLFENFPEETLKDFTPLYMKAKEKLEPVYYNSIPVITPAGRQSYQSGWLVPRIQNGMYDGMICTVEDVTSRMAAEEELIKSRELLAERVRERTVELLKANQRIQKEIEERKQQEETLKMSEARYRELVNHSKNAIVIYEAIDDGRDFIIKEFNHAAENIEQLKKESLIGKLLTEVFPNVKEFGLLDVLQRVWKTGKPEEYPVAFYHDERISGWRDNYAYKLPSGEIVVIYENITDRKREEEALRESEERFRIIFENAGIGITLVDRNGRFVRVNKALEKIYGYSAAELSAMSFPEITHPDDVQGNIEIFTELMEGKREYYQLEKRYIGKHNRAIWSRLTVSLLRDSSGSPHYALSMVEDITGRRQQEEALRESEERFRTIAESSLDAIMTADSSGKILYWNKAAEAIYGYTAEEIVGKYVDVLQDQSQWHPDRDNSEFSLERLGKSYIGNISEGIGVKKDGTRFIAEVSSSGWKLGDSFFASGIVRNITYRKQMEEQLRKSHDDLEKKVKQRTAQLLRANKELQLSQEHLKKFSGKLLSIRETERKNISAALHDELGSMVVAVSSAISIAKEEAKNGNKQAILKALEKSEAALRKAVVDLRRLAVDLRPPNLEIVGLPNALKNHIDTLKKSSNVTIDFRVDLTDQAIPDDAAIILYRVAQESLTNILKHAKAKKALVRLYGHTSCISIDISDDGVGFNPGKLRGKKAITKMGIQGMREQVESKGGEFIITSAPGQGTHVQATLPEK